MRIISFNEKFCHRQSRSDRFYFILIEEGRGKIQIDFYNHQIEDSVVYLITAGRAIKSAITAVKGYFLAFDELFVDLSSSDNRKAYKNILHHYFCHSPFLKPNEKSFDEFKDIFKKIYDEYHRVDCSKEVLLAYLKIALINYQREMKPLSNTVSEYDLVIELRSNIEQNYQTERKASFYANLHNLSLKRLNEIVKSSLDKTVTQLLHDRLILEAKRKLIFTEMAISEIAFSLGYEDANYFYRFFKKQTGATPKEFRRISK